MGLIRNLADEVQTDYQSLRDSSVGESDRLRHESKKVEAEWNFLKTVVKSAEERINTVQNRLFTPQYELEELTGTLEGLKQSLGSQGQVISGQPDLNKWKHLCEVSPSDQLVVNVFKGQGRDIVSVPDGLPLCALHIIMFTDYSGVNRPS